MYCAGAGADVMDVLFGNKCRYTVVMEKFGEKNFTDIPIGQCACNM